MKKNNLWRVIWIVGIYAVLVLILYLVIMYKVKWEDKDLHRYLYFYNCSDSLCTSDVAQDKYYSRILCEDDACPYVSSVNDNLVILNKKDKSWIYDYANEKILNDKYNLYEYLKDNYYIVKDNSNNVGLINNNDEIIIPLDKYGKIIDFKNDYLLYFKDGEYYVKNIADNNELIASENELILINNKLYGYVEDNYYYIASYDTKDKVNDNSYNYIFTYGDIILTINDKKIDIMTTDLKSTLIMRIATYYDYMVEKERDSLNIKVRDDILYFSVRNKDEKYTIYKYDLKNKKILT